MRKYSVTSRCCSSIFGDLGWLQSSEDYKSLPPGPRFFNHGPRLGSRFPSDLAGMGNRRDSWGGFFVSHSKCGSAVAELLAPLKQVLKAVPITLQN